MRPSRLLGAAAVAVLALTGCGSSGATAEPAAAVPAAAGHVHGMGVNPADGKLYLGTHIGTMVVDEDGVRPVGTATIDLMGFAVVGPDRFVSSGHPGPADSLPEPVGLLESTDAGRTWRSLSRAGESDFHALTATGSTFYGFDGELRRTDDGRTWTDAAAGVAPASLAVHPADPQTVLATTQHGPVLSTDGARSFTGLDGAPLLVLLAWPAPDAVWAVAPDGSVHASADGGSTWQRRGSAGAPPQAFTATADGEVVVALEDEIVRSTDGGATFTRLVGRE